MKDRGQPEDGTLDEDDRGKSQPRPEDVRPTPAFSSRMEEAGSEV